MFHGKPTRVISLPEARHHITKVDQLRPGAGTLIHLVIALAAPRRSPHHATPAAAEGCRPPRTSRRDWHEHRAQVLEATAPTAIPAMMFMVIERFGTGVLTDVAAGVRLRHSRRRSGVLSD
jgi:hypothetical protein